MFFFYDYYSCKKYFEQKFCYDRIRKTFKEIFMIQWIENAWAVISGLIGKFSTLASVIVLIILFFVFDFKFILRAYRMLRVLFKEFNMPWLLAMYLPWKIKKINKEDKKNRYKYLKAYCEYAILMSGGEKLTHQEWGKLNQSFFYEHLIDSPFNIILDSSFDILGSEINSVIANYFEFLNKNSRKYLHNRKNSKFVCKISFKNGYVYPSSFINGLEHKFSDSWTDLMIKYNYTLKNAKYGTSNSNTATSIYDNANFIAANSNSGFDINNNELFMTYSWLMWSPSYQMSFDDEKYKVILYGIGDESNTTNLILDTSKDSMQLWSQLKECLAKNTFGTGLSIECELYEVGPYLRNNLQNFSIESLPLLNNLINNSNDVNFILTYLNPTPDASIRKNFIEDSDEFFSGYLWALYNRIDDNHQKFDIKNSIAFFEHSNLADNTSVEYFTQALAKKTILHFKEVLNDKNPRYYKLALTVASTFEKNYINLIQEELAKESKEFRNKFEKYIDLNSRVSINEVLENIDEEFPLNEFTYTRVTTPEEIGEFYTSVYIDNFPENERDSIENLIDRTLKIKSNNHHDIILCYQGNELAGGIVFDYFKKSNCGVIEYVVVSPKYRGRRIAKKLVAKATADICNYSKNNRPEAIFIEVEDPEKHEFPTKETAQNNINRLQLWGNSMYNKVDITYVQPSLGHGQEAVHTLMLACNTHDSSTNTIDAKTLESFLTEYNQVSNRIDDVMDPKNGLVEMFEEIKSKPNGKVDIVPLVSNKEQSKTTK